VICGNLDMLAMVFLALQGPDLRDPASSLVPQDRNVETVRFGWHTKEPGVPTVPIAMQRVHEVVSALSTREDYSACGSRHIIDAHRVHETWLTQASVGVHAAVTRRRADGGEGHLTPDVKALELAGAAVTTIEMFNATEELGRIRADAARARGAISMY